MSNKIGVAAAAIPAALSQVTNDNFTNQVLLIIGIISGTLSIISSLRAWYKEAKADGKITIEEIKDGIDQINKNKEK